MKITTKEQREKRERKTKKLYSIAKKNVVRDHSFMTSAISTSIQFWSKRNKLLDVLNWHSITPGNLGIFLKNFNNEINIMMYNCFLCYCT